MGSNSSCTLLLGDCLERMKEIPDGSVDCVLCDPPYGTMKNAPSTWDAGKTAWDETLDHVAMLEQCNRILRTNGALALFAQDPYTAKLTTDTHGNLPFSYRMTWLKDTFANALGCKKAPVNYTEDVCLFFKKYDTLSQHPLRVYAKEIMFFLGMTSKEINADLGHRRADHFMRYGTMQFQLCTEKTYNELIEKYNIDRMNCFISYSDMEAVNRRFSRRFNLPEGKKCKSNVLEYKKDYTGLHPTQKPVALMEDLIRTYTDEGETVLDFTAGSFTTAIACLNTKRDFIGIELDDKYFEVGSTRVNEHVKTLDYTPKICYSEEPEPARDRNRA